MYFLRKIERGRNFLRTYLVCFILFVVVALAFGFSDSLGSLIVPTPKYIELFVQELAGEWASEMAMPVSVRLEKQTLADFRNTRIQGRPQWFEEQNLEEGIKLLEKNNVSRMIKNVEFVLLGDRQTIILIFQGRFLAVELPNVVPKDFPSRGLNLRGELRPMFAFSVSLQDLDLSRLHWRSAQDPDFTGFSSRLATIAVLFDDRRLDMKKFASRLRSAAAKDFVMMRKRIWVLCLPGLLILILFCALRLHTLYANFVQGLVPLAQGLMDQYNVEVKLPGYGLFLLTADLRRLHSETESWLKQERARLDVGARAERLAARRQMYPIREPLTLEQSLESRREERIERLRDRFHSLAASNPDPGGLSLIQEAERKADQRKKIELLKQGIRAQRSANLRAKDLSEMPELPETLSSSSEPATVQYLTLAKEVERLFPSLILPASVDPEMVREILLGLCEPGKDVHIFGANYRPLSGVRRLVVSRYRDRGQRFFPREFRDTLLWLVRQGIVLAHSKMPEWTYSLASKPEQGSSELARAIISQMIQFERNFRSQHKARP